MIMLRELLPAKDATKQPTATHIVCIDNTAVAQLDALPCPVHPAKVDVESCLDDAEENRDRVGRASVGVEFAEDPVDEVEGAVGAEEDDVEGGDYGGDRGLPEEKELREDADRFEDLGEDPEPLCECPGGFLDEDEHDEGGEEETSGEDDGRHFPRNFLLAGAGVDEAHYAEGIEGREEVEDFEKVVPCPQLGEEVSVAGDEDEGVEGLGDEGHALGAPIPVDGEDEDAFRRDVREVGQYSKQVPCARHCEGPQRSRRRMRLFCDV